MPWARVMCSVAVVMLAAPAVRAQVEAGGEEPASSEASEPARDDAALDVVRLANGGLLRGTIAELVPGEYVVIVLVTGERRRHAMDEVSYAGPRDEEPRLEAPEATTEAEPRAVEQERDAPTPTAASNDEVRVHVGSYQPGVTVLVQSGTQVGHMTGLVVSPSPGAVAPFFGTHHSTSYDRLCTAPCEVTLAPGAYTLALSEGNGDPVAVEESVYVSPTTTRLTARYESYEGTRVAGWVILGATTVLGVLGLYAVSEMDDDGCTSCDNSDAETLKWITIGGILGGLIAGTLMVMASDEAYVDAN